MCSTSSTIDVDLGGVYELRSGKRKESVDKWYVSNFVSVFAV
jgi:hypothetical protein